MTTNTAKITDAQIRTLRAEAAAAGDLAQVNLCDAALGLAEALMVDEAREACAAVIARAADMQDDGCLCDYETGTLPRRWVKTGSGPRDTHGLARHLWGDSAVVGFPGDVSLPSGREPVGLVSASASGPWSIVTLPTSGNDEAAIDDAGSSPHAWLCDYETGESVRPATAEEAVSSRAAARVDGGAGIIRVDGRRCYVEG